MEKEPEVTVEVIDLFPQYVKTPLDDFTLGQICNELLRPNRQSIHRMAVELLQLRRQLGIEVNYVPSK